MATGLLPTVPTTCPFLWQSIPDLTISPLIPVGMYGYTITCPRTLTKSLAAILNLPTNLFYFLDSVQALTSDNFPSIHPSRNPLVAPFINFLVKASLRAFTNIYSLPIDKDGRACRNISIKFPCVFVCLSYSDPFNFW